MANLTKKVVKIPQFLAESSPLWRIYLQDMPEVVAGTGTMTCGVSRQQHIAGVSCLPLKIGGPVLSLPADSKVWAVYNIQGIKQSWQDTI